MSDATPVGMPAAIEIRPARTMPEFQACVALQQRVWGFQERDLLPARIFMVIEKNGGQTLAAWDGERMVAFNFAMPGCRPGLVYWHSQMLAVDAAYRDRGLGRRLKLRQREEALARGIELIEWTFDPLEIKNGYFNLEVLGAISRRYYPNLYGLTSSALQAGLPTDRMVAEWWLRSPRVTRRLERRTEAAAARDEAAAAPVPSTRIEVPAEIHVWKAARDPRAAEVQHRNRLALAAAFSAGLAAVGYTRRPNGSGAFLLGQPEVEPSA